MPRFVVEIDADAFVSAGDRLLEATANWRSLLEKGVGPQIVRMVDQNFKRQGRPDQPWEPLKPETLRRRRKNGRGAQILQDTGRLRQSVSAQRRVTDNSWEIGSNLVYSRIHQFGGTVRARQGAGVLSEGRKRRRSGPGSATIPARPYLPDPMTEPEQKLLARILVHYLQQRLQRENA